MVYTGKNLSHRGIWKLLQGCGETRLVAFQTICTSESIMGTQLA